MLTLKDVADYITTLGIATQDHIWIGLLQDKVEHSIGLYPLKRSVGDAGIPIGGIDNTDHGVRNISILIHWDRNLLDTEENANALYSMLRDASDVTVNNKNIKFFSLLGPEPIPVGTDNDGIYEYVIEASIYYERNGD